MQILKVKEPIKLLGGGRGRKLVIGDYIITISPPRPNSVWIVHKSGEGGEFDREKFIKMIEDFYNEHF